MDSHDLLARLEKIESDSIGAGLARNWHRNPDGPEAAARIRRLLKEADDHAERVSHWRKTAGEYQARVEELATGLSVFIGYLTNAKIDLETGATKATAIRTIEGGIARARALLGERGE